MKLKQYHGHSLMPQLYFQFPVSPQNWEIYGKQGLATGLEVGIEVKSADEFRAEWKKLIDVRVQQVFWFDLWHLLFRTQTLINEHGLWYSLAIHDWQDRVKICALAVENRSMQKLVVLWSSNWDPDSKQCSNPLKKALRRTKDWSQRITPKIKD